MSVYSGNSGSIKAVSTGGSVAAVGEVKSYNLSIQSDLIESSRIGDTWKGNLAGLKGWEVSMVCNYDPDDAAQADLIEGAEVDLELAAAGDTSGRENFTGTGFVTSVEIAVESTAVVSYNVTVTGNGTLTRGTVSA
jgi:predicted secreted protein